MTDADLRALRRGVTITKQMRRKSTGEIFAVEIKRSWDRLYYSCDGCKTWHKTATEAHEDFKQRFPQALPDRAAS